MYRRVTIKIGSNVLARADGSIDVTRMSSLVDQVCTLRESGMQVIVITSGAVACGRSILADVDAMRMDNVSKRQLFSAVGQVQLMARYNDLFASHGVRMGQVLTMKENFSTRRHYLNQRNCMSVMLDKGVVPVVNENDTVSVTELMFTDNDELSGLVASMMDCDALIILSNIDGVYDGDPADPGAALIRRIAPGQDCSGYIQERKSGFGRGGMTSKYNVARKLADEGVEVIIANGKRSGVLTDLLVGNLEDVPCTLFESVPVASNNLKRWIAHSEDFVKGAVVVDAKAADALCSHAGTSLLPVGVVRIEGEFEKDDLVRVLAPAGSQIGVGRISCNSDEARQLLGRHDCRPLIHCDYLYLDNVWT